MIPDSVAAQLREYRRRHYSGHVLALVDGLQYQQHTGRQLTPEDDTAVSLFAGTRDIALAHAGPWLVDPTTARDRVADLVELERDRPGVIWLIASESPETQAGKLRPYLNIRLPDGRSALLRFWDPRVIHALDAAYRDKAARELFRTAYEWQYLHEGQRHTVNENDAAD